jgi:hypothetical protein
MGDQRIKDWLVQPIAPGGGGGPFAGGSGGAGQTTTFTGATPLGHPLAPILANWLDNHMFVASTLLNPAFAMSGFDRGANGPCRSCSSGFGAEIRLFLENHTRAATNV